MCSRCFEVANLICRWCFKIYDTTQDVATITDATEDGFTVTTKFNYMVRQTVYATQTIIRSRILSLTFSLKDNIKHIWVENL